MLTGRWKLLIVHYLLQQQPRRFSDLERAIPAVTQKMLIQQLRALENDGVVRRVPYPVVPPHVEYSLTPFGAALELALNALHDWAAIDPEPDEDPKIDPRSDPALTPQPVGRTAR